MNTEPFAYLAGLIDGEGCLTIRRYKRQYQAYLIIANNCPLCLQFAQDTLGGKVHSINRQQKQWLQYHLQGAQLGHALRRIIPHLITKRAQAELLLAFIERPARSSWRISDEELAEMEEYCRKLSELKGPNTKGRRRANP